jgi:hypothetical protein
MDELRQDIAALEDRIEHLREAAERCRKIALAARIVIAAGAAAALFTLLGVVAFYPTVFFGSLAALIGGVVLLGSNKTTWEQTDEALRKTEAMRDQLIGSIEMRTVGESPTLH